MAAPAQPKNPLVIYQGDTLSFTVTSQDSDGNPINVTGRTYAMKVRPSSSSSTVLATATCVVTDGANGVVSVTIPAATTAALDVGTGVADLEETNGSTVTTLVRWKVSIVEDVTR